MKTLIVLTGPTGVGKTELSLRLAERLRIPIISADSRQIYKDIRIGTAAPTEDELRRVRHYFVHSLELDEYYSAARYEEDVMALLAQLFELSDYALLTGGSMMYIDAVTKGIDDIPTVDDETRSVLKARLSAEGLEPLLRELKLLDPEYYELVDKRNTQRIVHALEICYMTGRTYTSFRTNTVRQRPFRVIKFMLNRDRQLLFDRINRRVDAMMDEGFLQEAHSVYERRNLNALNTVGYKELFNVISGEWELPMAVERIKKNTRVYAKKQLTWFKRDNDIITIDADRMDVDEMCEFITDRI